MMQSGKKRVLVAGAGYLGMAFADLLIRISDEYIVYLARRSPQQLPGFQSCVCDFTDASSLKDLPEVDAIFYAVAADEGSDEAYEKAYSIGLKNLVDHYSAQSSRPQFILSSTTSVYAAKAGEAVSEDTVELVTTGPSRFMVQGESYLIESGLSGAVLRFGGIYGPGRTRFLTRIRDRLEVLTPLAKQYMNRIHRDDAVGIAAFVLGLKRPEMMIINAVDSEASVRDDVIRWVVWELGMDVEAYPKDRTVTTTANHKRVMAKKLKGLGYQYIYPSFKEGYRTLLHRM